MALRKKQRININDVQWNDEELEQRVRERRKASNSKRRRKKALTLLLIVAVFAVFATMCGRDIVRLKAENRALKKQQAALEQQRDELEEELKSVNDKEYIREQARKQLKLLNPGEILFTFDDDQTEETADDSAEEDGAAEDAGSEDSGGSDG